MDDTHQSNISDLLKECNSFEIQIEALEQWLNHIDCYVQRNRQQFASIYPVLAKMIADNPNRSNHQAIISAIDSGTPIVYALSQWLRIPKWAIRRLSAKGPALLGKSWFDHPSKLLHIVSLIRLHDWPQTKKEWEAIWNILQVLWTNPNLERAAEFGLSIETQDETIFERTDKLYDYLIQSFIFGGICNQFRRLNRLTNNNLRQLQDLGDYRLFIERWCRTGAGMFEPNWYVMKNARVIADELLLRYSALEIVRQSVEWHKEILKEMNLPLNNNGVAELNEWPPLPGLPMKIGDFSLVSVSNQFKLIQESLRMANCVGTYQEYCRRGYSHIVSIRRNDSVCSTAEIALVTESSGGISPVVRQHEAYRHTMPSDEINSVLLAYLAKLQTNESQLQLKSIAEFHREQNSKLCSFDNDIYSVEIISKVMKTILMDYEQALNWLRQRLIEEDNQYAYRNIMLGERLNRIGFGDYVTEGEFTEKLLFDYNREGFDVLYLASEYL